ncbi:uncharacterized protein VTP21DRAFT_9441 [Calcarisporiella thermophila]|uniref:uncharacterized protein n=1 Tax=Calcarisporiella thermophila TaxID=911321 RepID=UPI00374268F3
MSEHEKSTKTADIGDEKSIQNGDEDDRIEEEMFAMSYVSSILSEHEPPLEIGSPPERGKKGKEATGTFKTEELLAQLPPDQARQLIAESKATPKLYQMTLKEQERYIDKTTKENFDLKMCLFFMRERLSKMSNENIERVLAENDELKKRIKELSNQLKSNKSELQEALDELEELRRSQFGDNQLGLGDDERNEYSHSLAAIERYRAELNELRRQIEERDQENQQLHRVLSERRLTKEEELPPTEGHQLKSRLFELEREVDILREEAEQLREYAEHERQRNTLLEEEHQQINAEMENLVEQMFQYKIERSSLILERDRANLISEKNSNALEAAIAKLLSHGINFNLDEDGLPTEDITSAQPVTSQMDDLRKRHLQKIRRLKMLLVNQRAHLIERLNRIMGGSEIRSGGDISIEANENLEDSDADDGDSGISSVDIENDGAIEEVINGVRDHIAELALRQRQAEEESKSLAQELEENILSRRREVQSIQESLEREINELKDVIAQQREDYAQEQSERHRLENDLRVLRDKEYAHREEMARLESELALAASRFEEDEENIEKLSQQVNHLENEKGELLNRVERLETQLTSTEEGYEKQLSTLNQRLEKCEEEREECSKILHEKETDILYMQEELAKWMEKSKEYEESKETYLQTVKETFVKLQEKDSELQFIKEQLNIQTERNRGLNESCIEAENWKKQLIQARLDLEKTARELDDLIDQNEKLHEINESLTNEKADAENSLRNAQEELKEKEDYIGNLLNDLTSLESRISEEQRSSDTSESQLRDIISQRNSLLVNIYRNLDIILNREQTELKIPNPTNNYDLFREHINDKVKRLIQLNQSYERRINEIYERTREQFRVLSNQMNAKSHQVNQLERRVDKAASITKQWAERLNMCKKENDDLRREIRDISKKKLELESSFNRSPLRSDAKIGEAYERLRKLEEELKDKEKTIQKDRKAARKRILELQCQMKNAEKLLEEANTRKDRFEQLVKMQQETMATRVSQKEDSSRAPWEDIDSKYRGMLDLHAQALEAAEKKSASLEKENMSLKRKCETLDEKLQRHDRILVKFMRQIEVVNERHDVAEQVLLYLREVAQEAKREI